VVVGPSRGGEFVDGEGKGEGGCDGGDIGGVGGLVQGLQRIREIAESLERTNGINCKCKTRKKLPRYFLG